MLPCITKHKTTTTLSYLFYTMSFLMKGTAFNFCSRDTPYQSDNHKLGFQNEYLFLEELILSKDNYILRGKMAAYLIYV